MTADLLRRGGVRAQELADGATPEWTARGYGGYAGIRRDGDGVVIVWEANELADAALIAACDPPFLRAVGEWLAAEAEVCVNDDGQNEPVRRSALAVARALLGESEEVSR